MQKNIRSLPKRLLVLLTKQFVKLVEELALKVIPRGATMRDARTFSEFARIRLSQKQWRSAAYYARLAIAIDDHAADAYGVLGEVRLRQGDFLAAVSALRAAIDRDSFQPLAHYWLAIALAAMSQPKDALVAAQRAANLSPGNRAFQELRDKLHRVVEADSNMRVEY